MVCSLLWITSVGHLLGSLLGFCFWGPCVWGVPFGCSLVEGHLRESPVLVSYGVTCVDLVFVSSVGSTVVVRCGLSLAGGPCEVSLV